MRFVSLPNNKSEQYLRESQNVSEWNTDLTQADEKRCENRILFKFYLRIQLLVLQT